MVTTEIVKIDPGGSGSGGGGTECGGSGGEGGRGNGRGNKRIKTNPGGDGGGGGGSDGDGSDGSGGSDGGGGSGSGGGSANPHVRTGECPAPPSDLVLVGRILDCPAPTVDMRAAGGKMLQVTVEAWMTDLYRSAHWWIELPNVEDVGDVNRGRLKVKAVPLGFTGSSLVSVENQSQGRMRLEGIRLALFSSGGSSGGVSSGWEMISGTPPAWFARVWNCTRSTSVEHPPSERAASRFADEFKNAKVYLSQAQVLQQQRDWLLV